MIETYKERRWIEKRKHILLRDKYMDKYLYQYGKFRSADIVHHIFPKNDFPEYEYEDWNLISVSKATHNLLHDRNTDRLTPKGEELLIRTARKNGIDIPYWYLQEKKGKKYEYRY